MSISEMFKRIDALKKKELGGGATDKEIADAERALGVRFPRSYKAFLSRLGWADIYYDTLFGLGTTVPPPCDLVKTALSERYELEPNIPSHLVPIMNDGAGNNYCLDTAKLRNDECPVVFWDHEHEDGRDQLPVQIAPSFDQWVIDLIEESPFTDDV
jgi:cell wall assembly regulator SMI1